MHERAPIGLEFVDVAVIPGDRVPDEDGTSPAGKPAVTLAEGLTLEVLSHDEAERYMDASESRGLNFDPRRQFSPTYAFVRRGRADANPYRFDHDLLLRSALQLSRYIRDNAHCAEYAVRVLYQGTERETIIPARADDLAHHTASDGRKWLSNFEAEELGSLLRTFRARREELPLRVNRAMWLAEYAVQDSRLFVSEIWTVAALEALLNTEGYAMRQQFKERTQALGVEVDCPVTRSAAGRL